MRAEILDPFFGYAVSAAFLALAGVSLSGWAQRRDGIRGYAGLAGVQLALAAVAFRVDDMVGGSRPTEILAAVAILGSGYALLLVRHRLIPLTARVMRGVAAAVVAALALAVTFRVPLEAGGSITGRQTFALIALVAVWSGCVGDPIVRFWLVARTRPAVQRARLRALAAGYFGLLALLGVSAAGAGTGSSGAVRGLVLPATLVLVGVLFCGFAPPVWLRRVWRQREERALMSAAPMFHAGEPCHIAEEALEWAIRLVGGDGAVLTDVGGRVLARRGVQTGRPDSRQLGEASRERACMVTIAGGWGQAAVVGVPLESGTGTLVVHPGPFTPAFGGDELAILQYHAANTAAALDRARLDEARRDFLTVASHELRTPLTVVLGLGRTLLTHGEKLPAGQQRELMDRLVVNSERLERILDDLLDLDRLSRGVLEPRRERVDIAEIVRDVVASSGLAARRRTRVIATSTPGNVDPMILRHVVANLAENAVKHTPEGTNVWVRAGRVGDWIAVGVEDDGPGVPEQLRDTVFEPFRRGPGAPAHAPGYGIGLALVSAFAAAHGGRAHVTERRGGGASFWVWLKAPISPSEPERRRVVTAAPVRRSPRRPASQDHDERDVRARDVPARDVPARDVRAS